MAGLGYTVCHIPTNWVKQDYNGWSANYTYDYVDQYLFSCIFQPMVEFTFKRTFGITVSPILMVNEKTLFAGFGCGLMMGEVRAKRYK